MSNDNRGSFPLFKPRKAARRDTEIQLPHKPCGCQGEALTSPVLDGACLRRLAQFNARLFCGLLALNIILGGAIAGEAGDLAIGHFGESDYGDWQSTGTAFRFGPASGSDWMRRPEIENDNGEVVASSEKPPAAKTTNRKAMDNEPAQSRPAAGRLGE